MNFIETGFKGKNDWWMYVLGIVFVFIGTQVGSLPLALVAFFKSEGDLEAFNEAGKEGFMNMGIDSNVFLFLMIVSFAVGLFGLYLVVKFIHKKKFKWIVTSRDQIDFKRVLFGFVSWGIVSATILCIGIYLEPELYVWNFKPLPFFILLVISLLFLPIQTSTEELLFRGYLMQGLGVLVKNKWFPLLFTSTIFGLLHMANPEIDKIGNIALVF
jgi:membrane protease YdiL (CAAX protease family)